MPSYFITGAARGLGFEFVQQLSSDPANTVIGLVRNKAETEAKIAPLKRANIHLLQGDLTDYESLKKAASDTAGITGGGLNYLVANAARLSQWSGLDSIEPLAEQPSLLEQDLLESFKTNVIGNIHLFNLFIPLVLNGSKKKVIMITSGLGDTEATAKYEFDWAAPYSISKAAGNMAVAKFSARYARDGVLFMSICPGVADTQRHDEMTEERSQKLMHMFGKLRKYEPSFAGPVPAEEAVRGVLAVMEKASLENGDGGVFVSHFGNKKWL